MNGLPDLCVVDTNVPVIANGKEADASIECEIACIDAVQTIVRSKKIVMDDADLILNEYRHYLSFAGQPGVGDEFMKWVHDHLWDDTRCVRVPLTPTNNSFVELPAVPELQGFDASDRKFAAV